MPNQHYVVSRSRDGWSVSAEADRVSEHATREEARMEAQDLVRLAEANGERASFVDLSDDPAP